MASEEAVRQHVGRLLAWEDAHVGFDSGDRGHTGGSARKNAGRPAVYALAVARASPPDAARHPRVLPEPRLRGAELAGRLLAGER